MPADAGEVEEIGLGGQSGEREETEGEKNEKRGCLV